MIGDLLTPDRAQPRHRRPRPLGLLIAVAVLAAGVVSMDEGAAIAGEPPVQGRIDVVYVAVGTNYPDSLGVGPGAAVNGAPIVLVPTDGEIPGPTQSALTHLDPRKVVIIGGTAVVSAEMEAAIEALLPDAIVERIAGANRYETNALFSQSIYPAEAWASVSATSFTTASPHTDFAVIGTLFAYNNEDADLYAPILLPHGAQILEIKADIFDDDVASDLGVELRRATAGGSPQLITSVQSSGNGGNGSIGLAGVSSGMEIVDNENYAYWIAVTNTNGTAPGSQRYVRRVMVKYRLGTLGA